MPFLSLQETYYRVVGRKKENGKAPLICFAQWTWRVPYVLLRVLDNRKMMMMIARSALCTRPDQLQELVSGMVTQELWTQDTLWLDVEAEEALRLL